MLQSMKQKFDLYFDSGLSILNQAINSPKAPIVASPTLIGIGMTEVNSALETASLTLGLIIGGFALWSAIGNKSSERKKRKEEAAIRAMEFKNLKLKNSSLELKNSALENHIKKK